MDTYFEADEGVICANCHARLASRSAAGGSTGFGRAVLFGIAASAVSAAIYFALLAATGREISVAVLLVGFVVGKAVRVGSKGRGGRRFQWLAVGLTYLAIAATYVPFVMKGFTQTSSASTVELLPASTTSGSLFAVTPVSSSLVTPPKSLGKAAVDYTALLLLAAAAPILEGLRNVIMLLLTMAAMFQAWRMNRRITVTITGPYRVRM